MHRETRPLFIRHTYMNKLPTTLFPPKLRKTGEIMLGNVPDQLTLLRERQ